MRELAAALLVAGDKASSKGQRGVEELVLAGVSLFEFQPDHISAAAPHRLSSTYLQASGRVSM